jgi:hypothetical protein
MNIKFLKVSVQVALAFGQLTAFGQSAKKSKGVPDTLARNPIIKNKYTADPAAFV